MFINKWQGSGHCKIKENRNYWSDLINNVSRFMKFCKFEENGKIDDKQLSIILKCHYWVQKQYKCILYTFISKKGPNNHTFILGSRIQLLWTILVVVIVKRSNFNGYWVPK